MDEKENGRIRFRRDVKRKLPGAVRTCLGRLPVRRCFNFGVPEKWGTVHALEPTDAMTYLNLQRLLHQTLSSSWHVDREARCNTAEAAQFFKQTLPGKASYAGAGCSKQRGDLSQGVLWTCFSN